MHVRTHIHILGPHSLCLVVYPVSHIKDDVSSHLSTVDMTSGRDHENFTAKELVLKFWFHSWSTLVTFRNSSPVLLSNETDWSRILSNTYCHMANQENKTVFFCRSTLWVVFTNSKLSQCCDSCFQMSCTGTETPACVVPPLLSIWFYIFLDCNWVFENVCWNSNYNCGKHERLLHLNSSHNADFGLVLFLIWKQQTFHSQLYIP